MERVDCVIAGAGVVGLAVARSLALAGHEPLVLDAAYHIGTGTSSRNSEVIHAGLYYPPGSLKAKLCLEGRKLLYDFLAEREIAHSRCGKLIVATSENQIPALNGIMQRANACGVDDLSWVSVSQARQMEPELNCSAALYSPSTGIVDSHQLMLALQAEAEANGAQIVFGTRVLGGRPDGNGIVLSTEDVETGEQFELSTRSFINAAGLHAHDIANAIATWPANSIPPLRLAKGSYFSLVGRSPFSHLIYPLPSEAGLGIHLTIDLAGQARFGPDVEWVDEIDYTVDPAKADQFQHEIRNYWPGLPDGALLPAYSGIRPKLSSPGEAAADFTIQGPDTHGIGGLINLFGIESPGLTASLAIANHVYAAFDVRA
jgi:L-2-hydroxyglutarate oxidase LhgO